MNARTLRLPIAVVGLLVSCAAGAPADEPADERQLLAWLRDLDPLPKVHYSWPVPFKTISDELLLEYARLTHAVSVSGEWSRVEDVERAVRICAQVNRDAPAIQASVGVNFSPWHRRFGKDLPPTDFGRSHQAELDYLAERLESVRLAVAEANRRFEADVAVTCVLFDSERFHVKRDDNVWNETLTAKYDAVYKIARETFLTARIEWYGRGAIQPGASSTGWSESTLFRLDEYGESFGCSLYRVPEIETTRETFRRTAENAARHDCAEVTPWIALASGYRRQTDTFHEWSLDWNYDLIYSWQLGAEINRSWYGVPERAERFAPWHKAKIAVFYPEPFGRSPHWGRHFVAYVRGAQGIKSLPESDGIQPSRFGAKSQQ